jgi:hypothetical protein
MPPQRTPPWQPALGPPWSQSLSENSAANDLERTKLRTPDFLRPSPSCLLVRPEWSWMALLLNHRGTRRDEPREQQRAPKTSRGESSPQIVSRRRMAERVGDGLHGRRRARGRHGCRCAHRGEALITI